MFELAQTRVFKIPKRVTWCASTRYLFWKNHWNHTITKHLHLFCLSCTCFQFWRFINGCIILSILTFKKNDFICFNESSLQMMKNVSYLICKALSILKIFKFLSWLFGHEKPLWKKAILSERLEDKIADYRSHII